VLTLLWAREPQIFLTAFLLVAISAVMGVALGHQLTRREFSAWAERFTRRTDLLFRGERILDDNPGEDLGSALDKITRSIERTLGAQVRGERDSFISTITTLVGALEARDPYTRNHSASVAKIAVRIGRRMGLSRDALYEIHLGGLLHDLGKIGIRDEILLKPTGLTREEYEIMKTHPTLGARMISGVPGLGNVARVVLHHHEMFDGRGYPDGLAGEEIPLGARIIAVADTYLSLVEHRPYRQGRRLDRAIAEIQRVRGQQLDPQATDALLQLVEEEERDKSDAARGSDSPIEEDFRRRVA
jgi:HD-GYP domain-containing protein (c-di-GMP phosphodiesterase class II)